jgi:hypothetical protein
MWPSNIECASLDHRSRAHADQVCKEVLARLTFKAHENAYCCNKDDLIRLGQRFDPKLRDPSAALQRGSEQFKVSFDNLRKAFTESSWARENILIAIAGSETDGTSGVRDGADATLRQEMEKFAHIIFASSAAQRDFWLGRRNLSFPKIISGRNGGAARTRSGDCRPRQRLPPRLDDAHPRDLDRAPSGDHALGVRGREPGADKLDHLLNGETMGQH